MKKNIRCKFLSMIMVISILMSFFLAIPSVNAVSTNLLTNGDFEIIAENMSVLGWKSWPVVDLQTDSTVKSKGVKSLKLSHTKSLLAYQELNLELGETYDLDFDIYPTVEGRLGGITLQFNANSAYNTTTFFDNLPANQWARRKITFVVPEDLSSPKVQIQLRQLASSKTVYFDDVVLTKSIEKNILMNGGFETINSDNSAEFWSAWPTTPIALTDTVTKAEGEKALKISHTSSQTVAQKMILIPGKTYDIKAKLNYQANGSLSAAIKLQFSNTAGAYSSKYDFQRDFLNTGGAWVEHTVSFTVPEGMPKLELILRELNGGTVYWDDIRVTLSETENILTNGGFEQLNMANAPEYWNPWPVVEGTSTITNITKYEGNNSLKISHNANLTVGQKIPFTQGRAYKLSFWLNAEKPSEGGSVKAAIKFQFKDQTKDFEIQYSDIKYGEWENKIIYFTAPTLASNKQPTVEIIARLFPTNGKQTVYFDKMELVPDVDSFGFYNDKGEKIVDLQTGNITAKWHKLSQSSNSENATMIVVLYKNINGVKKLINIAPIKESSMKLGTPLSLESSINVDNPANCTLEAFFWNSDIYMNPILPKVVK